MSDDDLLLRAQGRIGTVLGGKYRIDGVLGVGGMAVVFAATHRNQRRVAIKMLHPGISIHREIRERFLREGYAANTVDHPGAVAVLDDDTAEDGAAFLVMERLDGDEVDRLCQARGGRLGVEVVLAIADGLLAVLEAAHAKAIVHRDIKPENLYVTRDGTLKVLDFGIARLRDVASGGATATKTGMMMGTPAFMSPEQALSKSSEIDGRSDLWSVGATLWNLLSGSFVHGGETVSAIIVQAATQPARPLAAALPGVDPRVAAIVDRALAFDKAARWPDAAAMRAAVRAVYLEMFGKRVGREPLEQLFTEAVGTANTVAVPSMPFPPADAPAPARVASVAAAATPPPFVAAWPSHAAPPTPPPGGHVGGPAASAPPGPVVPPRKPLLRDLVVGATIGLLLACGGVWLIVGRGASAPSAAPPAPTGEPSVAVAASAAPPITAAPSAEAKAPGEPSAEPKATPPDEPVIAPATSLPVKPAPWPAVTSASRPSPAPAPAPTPVPAPVYTPPPATCKAQCTDTARACKASCKSAYRLGHDRHQCLVSCETVEKDCKSRAPC